MSSFVKVLAGVLVATGVPAAFAFMLYSAGHSYAGQHVVHTHAEIQNGQAVAFVHEYDHGHDGIVAVYALCGLAGVVVAVLAILAGGAMIVNRNKSWA